MLAKKVLASQHVLDAVFGNAPPNAILPDFSSRGGNAREARRYAQDDCHALGWDALTRPLPRTSRWAVQYLDPVSRAFHGVCPFGLEIESTRQAGLFLKFPGLILKFPRIKGRPQRRREKGLQLELWVGSICLPLARGVGAPRLVSSFEIGPATSHSCFPVVAAPGLNRICS